MVDDPTLVASHDLDCPERPAPASGSVWITVSHPMLRPADQIGDMIRLKTIARALALLGYTPKIITLHGNWECDTPEPTGDTCCAGPVSQWAGLIPESRLRSTLKDFDRLLSSRRLDRILRTFTELPSLIIDYNYYWNSSALRFASQHGIPIILNYETLPWDSMIDPGRSYLFAFGKAYERRKYGKYRALWPVSAPLADALAAFIGSRLPLIQVVPNAVESVDVPVPIPRHGSEQVVIGFIGGLSPWYALPQLVGVAVSLREEGYPLKLVIVGDGPDRESIAKQIRVAQADAFCFLVGQVPHSKVPYYLSTFDIGVITNHKWWTSPLKLLEYGASGVAVVAPRLPSITSLVVDGDCELFEPGDFDELRQRMKLLLESPARRLELAARLRTRVAASYTVSAMAENIAAHLYRCGIPISRA